MGVIAEDTNLTQYFAQLYKDHEALLKNASNEVIQQKRLEALLSFENIGIPTKKFENYKYTHLEPHFRKGYRALFGQQNSSIDVNKIFRCDIPELDTYLIILINGFYYHEHNKFSNLPEGITIDSLQEAIKKYPDVVNKHFGKYASLEGNGLVSLNTVFVQDGVFIHAKPNAVFDKPVQIINLLISPDEIMVQHRNLFVFEENSQGNIVVCDHTLANTKYLTNSVSEIYVAENAVLDYNRVQNEHNDSIQLSNIFLQQEANSNVYANTITLHGGIIRNNVNVKLNGEGASNSTNGLFLSDRNQHVDSFTFIEHLKPHCFSNQHFKGVLDDKSTGAFNGRIYVEQDAQKTLAYQSNNNILLTDDAKMNSKPQLEIYADDVKCSHGATVGQLDREALFYMRTRGINEIEARHLLMHAFAYEILKEIRVEPLRERMEQLVNKRLRGELANCDNCALLNNQ